MIRGGWSRFARPTRIVNVSTFMGLTKKQKNYYNVNSMLVSGIVEDTLAGEAGEGERGR